MNQAISLVTLGVSDYARAKAFYEALGWQPAMDVEETAFFQANGVVLVLWSREKLAADMGVADDGASWGGVALAHNVGSKPAGAQRRLDRGGRSHRRGRAGRRRADPPRAGADLLRRLRGCLPRPRRPRLG